MTSVGGIFGTLDAGDACAAFVQGFGYQDLVARGFEAAYSTCTYRIQRSSLRHIGRGTSFIAVASPASDDGTHTTGLLPRSAVATAAPTASGVVASGAEVIPAVIRPVTNPGLTSSSRTPEPCSASA